MAAATLTALEERLRRVELLLRGDEFASDSVDADSDEQTRPAALRLDKIEKRLADLCSHSAPAAELLRLHSRLPELLDEHGAPTADADATPAAQKLPIVLASSAAISNSALQLEWIRNNPMPASDRLAQLAALTPRLRQIQQVQVQQAEQVARLRDCTSGLLAQWYGDAILADGGRWVDWEQRLTRLEQTIRRHESSRERLQSEL